MRHMYRPKNKILGLGKRDLIRHIKSRENMNICIPLLFLFLNQFHVYVNTNVAIESNDSLLRHK